MKRVLWALFGNDDDSVIGDKVWNPEQLDTPLIRIKWWLRNPLHNLMFYVIPFGFGNVKFSRYGNVDVFRDSGWGWAILKYKYWRMPFISYYGRVKFYVGWRERGNFGIKLTWNSAYASRLN